MEFGTTTGPQADATAMPDTDAEFCSDNELVVVTRRSGGAQSDTVGFRIAVP